MIKRLIQLILDQQAAKRLEREVDRLMRNIARQSESRMSAAFRRIGATVVAAFSLRALVGFTRQMFRIGAASEETASKVEEVFGSERAAQLDTFLARFARMAGLTRTEGRDMLANFGAVFQGAGLAADASADLAEQAVRMAADFQSFHDVPIAETFAAIRSGATGEAEPLKRFGIVLRAVDVDARALANTGKRTAKELTEQERVVARMQLIFEKAGAAVGNLEKTQGSTANRTRSVITWFRQLREDLAVGLLPVFRLAVVEIGNASGFFDGMTGAVQRLTVWVRENLQAIRDWGIVVVRVAQATVETFRFMGRMVINAFTIVGTHLAAEWMAIRERFAGFVNFVLEGLDKIPGVEIDFRMNQMTPEEFAEAQRLLYEDMAGDADDMVDALFDLAEAYRDVGRAAGEAASGQTAPITSPDANAPPVVPPPTVPEPDDPTARDVADRVRQMREELERERIELTLGEEAALRYSLGLQGIVGEAQDLIIAQTLANEALKRTRDGVVSAAGEMTEALETFFGSAADGFKAQGGVWAAAGEAARSAGAAIVSGLVAGRAEEQIAQGTAALASGIWPPNPAALLAAGKHFAAAALFKAIPGIVRGAGGGGGGGGGGLGGVGGIPPGAIGTSVPGSQPVVGPEVHIYMDPLSPADPRFQRVVMGATQNAEERFGENVQVHVHPRSGAQ